ncbi:thioredoxin [bacterium]|nr:thioredoxin [bacterium]
MTVINITDTNFEEEVIRANMPVLVDFWAAWCAPCKMIVPILEELAEEYESKVKVAKVNVDENPIKTSEYKIMSIPNLKFFKEGKVVDEIIGGVPKKVIKKKLDSLL